MALPVLTLNAGVGSDSEASGAGPAAAVFGTNARILAGALTKIGLFEADEVDLSEVAEDGSALAWVGTSSTARKWSPIVDRKLTRQATEGNITNGAAVLSALGDTTGMSAGDPIMVVGAGALGADLYSRILTVDSSVQVTLTSNAGTTVTGSDVLCPEHLVVSVPYDSAVGPLDWAVGGERDTMDAGARAPYDVPAGTRFHFKNDTGAGYVGRWTLPARFYVDAEGRPLLETEENDQEVFVVQADGCRIADVAAGEGPAFILADHASVKSLVVSNVIGPNLSGHLLKIGSAVTSGAFRLELCGLLHPGAAPGDGSLVKCTGAANSIDLDFCELWDVGYGLANGVTVTGATAVRVFSCAFDTVLIGVDLGSSSSPGPASSITYSVFRETVNKCVYAGHVERARGLVVRGDTLEAQTHQIDLPSGGEEVAGDIGRNTYVTEARLHNLTMDALSVVVAKPDVGLRNEAAQDYRGGLSMRGAGGPAALPFGTPIALDRGIQRREPLGGGILVEIRGAYRLDPSTVQLQLYRPTGSSEGYDLVRDVPISGLPEDQVDGDAVDAALAAAVSQEVLG